MDKVATGGYFVLVSEYRTVGVKELKNQLSAYLREVRRGVRVLVSDRNRVVAELHEPGASYAVDGPLDPTLAGWIESGSVTPPTTAKSPLPESPVALKKGIVERLLGATREDADS